MFVYCELSQMSSGVFGYKSVPSLRLVLCALDIKKLL